MSLRSLVLNWSQVHGTCSLLAKCKFFPKVLVLHKFLINQKCAFELYFIFKIFNKIMNRNKIKIISYNEGSNRNLVGLKQLLEIHNLNIAFLQEVTISTDQLNAYLGSKYEGLSNIDPEDQRKPWTACVWVRTMTVVVANILVCRFC